MQTDYKGKHKNVEEAKSKLEKFTYLYHNRLHPTWVLFALKCLSESGFWTVCSPLQKDSSLQNSYSIEINNDNSYQYNNNNNQAVNHLQILLFKATFCSGTCILYKISHLPGTYWIPRSNLWLFLDSKGNIPTTVHTFYLQQWLQQLLYCFILENIGICMNPVESAEVSMNMQTWQCWYF